MLILVPILLIVAIILAIDFLYFSDPKPKDVPPSQEVHQKTLESNATKNYLDRYIKK